MSGARERLHATAIAVGRRAVLIRGPSGAGKSDLALRCLALAPSKLLSVPVALVADDQVIVERGDGGHLAARAPDELRGKLEVRGIGILEVAAVEDAEVVLVAELVRTGPIDRLPDPWPTTHILGVEVALMRLLPFEASAAMKLIAGLAMAPLPRVEPNP